MSSTVSLKDQPLWLVINNPYRITDKRLPPYNGPDKEMLEIRQYEKKHHLPPIKNIWKKNKRKLWTTKEVQLLLTLRKQKKPIQEIMVLLGRTKMSIYQKEKLLKK